MSIFKTIWSRFALKMMESRLYRCVLLKIIPHMRFSFYYTSMCGRKYRLGYSALRPGDIIVSKDDWKLTSFLIPGELVHASLCVGKSDDGSPFEVAEMREDGYRRSDFYDICHEADRVVILRCKDWDDEYVSKVIETCLSFEGVDYDVKFQLGIKTLYCSELIVASDPEKRLQVSYADLIGLNRLYISPMGIYKAKNVDVIWDSNNSKTIK
jgi:hypothetical protein